MSEDCCVTICKVEAAVTCCREFVNNFFLLLKNHQKSTNFYQTNLFRTSFPGKQVPSLTSEPTYFRAPSGLFRRLFSSFLRISVRFYFFVKYEFEIRFSLVLMNSTSDR